MAGYVTAIGTIWGDAGQIIYQKTVKRNHIIQQKITTVVVWMPLSTHAYCMFYAALVKANIPKRTTHTQGQIRINGFIYLPRGERRTLL